MKSCPQCNLRFPADSTTCFLDGSTLVALRDPWLGGTIAGKYVLDELVGVGGMGRVYRAEQKVLNRTVAVKIIHPHLLKMQGFFKRFLREGEVGKKIRHPNVVATLDLDGISVGDETVLILQGECVDDDGSIYKAEQKVQVA